MGFLLTVDEDGSSRTDTCGQAAKKHGQAAKAQLATGPAKHMSLDEMDKNGGMGVRVVESIEVCRLYQRCHSNIPLLACCTGLSVERPLQLPVRKCLTSVHTTHVCR